MTPVWVGTDHDILSVYCYRWVEVDIPLHLVGGPFRRGSGPVGDPIPSWVGTLSRGGSGPVGV